jgi:hypothetical protein
VASITSWAQSTPCGTERWPVKTFSDKDWQRVSLEPVATTIHELAALPMPEVLYPQDRRMAPHELKTYVVRGRIVATKFEADQDLHIVLQDPDDGRTTMIVEVPSPACTPGNSLQAKFESARKVLQRAEPGTIVEVAGIGFFDFIHNAAGQAPNGFELHPLISAAPPRQ